MKPLIATVLFLAGIPGLFYLDRSDGDCRLKALWIPLLWFLINASRPVSVWLGIGAGSDRSEVYLEGSPVDRVVYACLLIAGVLVLASRTRRVGDLLRRNGALVLFFSYCFASAFWSDFPGVTLKHWIKGVGDLVMVLIILSETDPLFAIRQVITPVAFVLVPLSVLFCKYYPALGRHLTHSWTIEYTGVAMQKNSLGALCLVCGLEVLWCFRTAYRKRGDIHRGRHQKALGAVLAMAVLLYRMSDSMTSLAGFLMAGSVMLVIGRPTLARKRAIVHCLLVFVLGASLFALFFDSKGVLVRSLGRDATLTGRTDVWAAVLAVPVNRVFGAGYESFWLGERLERVWAAARFTVNEAHDGYLEVFLTLGWVGIALIAVLMFIGYRNVIRAYRGDPDGGSLRVAYFVAAATYNFTEAGFRMLSPVWFCFLLATVAYPRRWCIESRHDSAHAVSFRSSIEEHQEVD